MSRTPFQEIGGESALAARIAEMEAENKQLRAEIEQLRTEPLNAPPKHLIPYKDKMIWLHETDGYVNATVYSPGWRPEVTIIKIMTREMAEFHAKRWIDNQKGVAMVSVVSSTEERSR